MEERQENLLEFDDTFRFKDLPDTSTPHNAPNMNKPLDNTSYLKKYIEDIITGKVDLVVKSIKSVNLFDSERWYNELRPIREASMEKVEVDGINYYKVNPLSIDTYEFMKGEFKENTQYTIKFKARHNSESSSGAITGFKIVYTDGTNPNFYVKNTIVEEDYTITTESNKTIDCIRLCHNYNGFVLFRDIMLYEGTDNKEYSPHQF